MADLIERGKLWDNLNDEFEMGVTDAFEAVNNAFDNTPTVDAEPVRHGHWVGHWENDSFSLPGEYRCSACRGKAPGNLANDSYILSDYCPHCGAKMDEEVKEDGK